MYITHFRNIDRWVNFKSFFLFLTNVDPRVGVGKYWISNQPEQKWGYLEYLVLATAAMAGVDRAPVGFTLWELFWDCYHYRDPKVDYLSFVEMMSLINTCGSQFYSQITSSRLTEQVGIFQTWPLGSAWSFNLPPPEHGSAYKPIAPFPADREYICGLQNPRFAITRSRDISSLGT